MTVSKYSSVEANTPPPFDSGTFILGNQVGTQFSGRLSQPIVALFQTSEDSIERSKRGISGFLSLIAYPDGPNRLEIFAILSSLSGTSSSFALFDLIIFVICWNCAFSSDASPDHSNSSSFSTTFSINATLSAILSSEILVNNIPTSSPIASSEGGAIVQYDGILARIVNNLTK